MTKEITKRQGCKWVKITHVGYNKYTVAFGFRGDIKAIKVNSGSKVWSKVASENWLNDQ